MVPVPTASLATGPASTGAAATTTPGRDRTTRMPRTTRAACPPAPARPGRARAGRPARAFSWPVRSRRCIVVSPATISVALAGWKSCAWISRRSSAVVFRMAFFAFLRWARTRRLPRTAGLPRLSWGAWSPIRRRTSGFRTISPISRDRREPRWSSAGRGHAAVRAEVGAQPARRVGRRPPQHDLDRAAGEGRGEPDDDRRSTAISGLWPWNNGPVSAPARARRRGSHRAAGPRRWPVRRRPESP